MKKKLFICLSMLVMTILIGSHSVFAGENWLWPVDGYYNISSGYGQRSMGWHQGIDISSGGINGKPVRASKSGYATVYHNNASAGNYISINHGDGYVSRYLHLSSIAISNGNVSRGQIIGYVGNTGNSTGPHLHFDIKVNGKEVNPMPTDGRHTYSGSSAPKTYSISYDYDTSSSQNQNTSSELKISNPNQIIRYGNSGNAVTELQQCLNKLISAGLVVDGKFGDKTLAAVKKFQSQNGLAADGDAGPLTNNKINVLLNKHTHSFGTYNEGDHPHKEYKKCSCGYYEYTGNTKKVNGCELCYPHEHSFKTSYESAHPHREYRQCSCGHKEYTDNYEKVDNCEKCYPHEHFYEIYYESSHPHKEYKLCECGERKYTGNTKKRDGCEKCYSQKSKVLKLQIGVPNMILDGVEKEIDPGRGTAPLVSNNRTLLPIRVVAESFNAYVVWDEISQKVTVYKDDIEIELWIDKSSARVNGEIKQLDVTPVLINGRTFMPLRFIAENMGLTVGWNEENRTVTIEG